MDTIRKRVQENIPVERKGLQNCLLHQQNYDQCDPRRFCLIVVGSRTNLFLGETMLGLWRASRVYSECPPVSYTLTGSLLAYVLFCIVSVIRSLHHNSSFTDLSKIISGHLRHFSRSATTTSLPSETSPLAVTKFPFTLCASISLTWSCSLVTSVAENYVDICQSCSSELTFTRPRYFSESYQNIPLPLYWREIETEVWR